MRSFIAIEISDEVRSGLAAFQKELRNTGAQVRWVRPETMHLTLAFLGELPEAGIESVRAAMDLSVEGSPALHLDVSGAGTFGPRRSPRVVWAGLGGDVEALQAIHAKLAEALRAAGFETEDRPFSPHITLGRIRGRRNLDAMLERIDTAADQSFGSIQVKAITFFKSELLPEGALHTPVFEASLTNPGSEQDG
jgi:2'-5' RNA ligase